MLEETIVEMAAPIAPQNEIKKIFRVKLIIAPIKKIEKYFF